MSRHKDAESIVAIRSLLEIDRDLIIVQDFLFQDCPSLGRFQLEPDLFPRK